MRRVLSIFRDPLRCFLLVALLAGGTLVWLVPPFGGTDEAAHFYRTYQITNGRFVPQDSPTRGSVFHGACIPSDVIRQVDPYLVDVLSTIYDRPVYPKPHMERRFPLCPGKPGERFVQFSTFGSPLPYLPQAATIGLARAFGAGVLTMDRVGRMTTFLAYVLLIGLAIRRSPRARWAFVAVGLLPVALFQAATITHDGLTTAIALLVVSSALRVADPPLPRTAKSVIVEAAALGLVLALCKPTYVVLALLYLLPLLGPGRRRELRPLAAVVGGAIVVSIAFNAAVENFWRTDADLLGIHIDPDAQRHTLLHRPWDFAERVLNSIPHYAGDWVRGLLNVGDRVVDIWPLALLLVIGAVIVIISLQADDDEPPPFHWTQRTLVLITFVLGVLLVFAANYIYYTGPNDDEIGGLAARYFVPLLVLVPLAVGSLQWAWARARHAIVPAAVVYAPFYVAFLVAVGDRMR